MPTSQTDTIATVLARPAPRTNASLSVQTPQQAMAMFEARRAATFALGLAALATFALVIVLVIGGDKLAEEVHCAALAATAAAAIAYTIDARDPRRYRSWKPIALAYVAIFANVSGFFYWGVLSAYIAVVPISAYAFASGMGGRRMLGTTVLSIAGHLGLGAVQLEGVIGNHGWVLEIPAMTPGRAFALLIILQLVLVAAVLAGTPMPTRRCDACSTNNTTRSACSHSATRSSPRQTPRSGTRVTRRGPLHRPEPGPVRARRVDRQGRHGRGLRRHRRA